MRTCAAQRRSITRQPTATLCGLFAVVTSTDRSSSTYQDKLVDRATHTHKHTHTHAHKHTPACCQGEGSRQPRSVLVVRRNRRDDARRWVRFGVDVLRTYCRLSTRTEDHPAPTVARAYLSQSALAILFDVLGVQTARWCLRLDIGRRAVPGAVRRRGGCGTSLSPIYLSIYLYPCLYQCTFPLVAFSSPSSLSCLTLTAAGCC